jgi:hypothetical protein
LICALFLAVSHQVAKTPGRRQVGRYVVEKAQLLTVDRLLRHCDHLVIVVARGLLLDDGGNGLLLGRGGRGGGRSASRDLCVLNLDDVLVPVISESAGSVAERENDNDIVAPEDRALVPEMGIRASKKYTYPR